MRGIRQFLRALRPSGARLLVVAAAAAALLATVGGASGAVPPNFQESVVFSGLSNPTAVRFASDGRVFVAEKSGRVKVFSDLSDPSPTIFADLNAQVHNFWDRGLLGLALHPDFPTTPYVYVLYAFDGTIGGSFPRWGTPGVLSDPCPTPPGATADGCVVGGRLSRLTASGDTWTGVETVLVEDFCQQYPSHSVGDIAFGADGALYLSSGDGASFNFVDYGQDGNPLNPCGDPPGGVGGSMTPPNAQGGALRSQDVRSSGDPTSLDGSLLRLDPITGAAMPDNPNAFSSDPNTRRIVAHGFRNPFKLGIRPNTNEVWLGDVGWNDWEEVNRVADPLGTVENFGWPCYEGDDEQPGYAGANLSLCESLYPTKPVVDPYFTYDHSLKVVAGEACPSGSSSIVGSAFYDGGNYPASYFGAMFFADYSRDCIWAMRAGPSGLPDPNDVITFVSAAANPVDVEIGPGGDLFYSDFDGGTIRRVRYLGANQAPVASATATPSSGQAPLNVAFSASGSSDPDGGTLTYAWDLDGDGLFDDSTSAAPTRTYTTSGTYNVRLRVTDSGGATDVDDVQVQVSTGAAPVPTIGSPAAGTTWAVGDTISFSGSATDAEDGTIPASGLSWSLILHHCPSNCHSHPIQEFVSTASGSIVTPDHEYPSHLELRLTATDSAGQWVTTSRQLDPRTTTLNYASSPSGMRIAAGAETGTTPFSREVIVGSSNSVSALSPQNLAGSSYVFTSWSDGGAQSHNIVAPAAPTTYTATFSNAGPPVNPGLVLGMSFDEGSGSTANDASGNDNIGAVTGPAWTTQGRNGGALEFAGAGMVSVTDSATLDLTTGMTLEAWVYPTALSPSWRTVILKEQATEHAYALYANEGPNVPGAHVFVGGRDRRARGVSSLPLNTWTHLAATYDAAVLRLYANGVEIGTLGRAGVIATSDLPLRIGGNTIFNEPFQGRIDDVRVYNRALTPAQIQADMNTPVSPPPPADSTPPSAPGTLTATGSLGQAQLTWGAASDNLGVSRYNLHRSTTAGFLPGLSNRIAQPTGLSYTDNASAGVYFYKVIAEDAAGNLGPASNEASATITADTTPPTVTLTAPANGATLTGTATLSATAADNVAVAGVTFKDGSSTIGSEDTSPPYSVQWTTTSAPNGSHTLTAIARDAAGNTTTSTPITITIDNTATPPPTGLVAGYAFDEGSGGTTGDASGNGNVGTVSGAAWSTQGRNGGALSFDGTNDLVSIADAAMLDVTTGVTLEAWVFPTSLGSAWRTAIFKHATADLVYGLYANRNTGVPNAQVFVGGSARAVNGSAGLAPSTWSHLAATYDGAAIRIYVNGVEVGVVGRTGAITTSTGALTIGGNTIWAEWFAGRIDDVRVYNRALTPAQIQADMNTPVSPPPPADSTPPSAPGTLTATGSLGQAQLTWGAASDNLGVSRYNLHRSTTAGFLPGLSNRIAQPTGLSYTDNASAGVYFYKVIAEDAAGNLGPASNEASATITADTTPPTVTLTAPANGATLTGTATLSATAADNVAVAGVTFKDGSSTIGSEDTSPPYSVQWTTTSAPNGSHTLTAIARDAAGNTTTSTPITITIDNTATPPPTGLVAAYSFDAATGTALADHSGNGNAGTISGATWTTPGRFGSALDFDGTNDMVTVPDATTLDLTTGMTLEAWVRPAALGTAWRTVLFKDGTGDLVYGLYANRNTGVPNAQVFIGSARSVNGTAALPLDAWSHLATTYDGANLRLFVNGTQVASIPQTGSIATSTGGLRIGGNGIWPEFFRGLIDEIRVYNRALTQVEIQADMNASVGVPDTTPPSTPTNLAWTASSPTSISVSWTASTDNAGIANYNLFRNGGPAGTSPTTSTVFSGLTCGTSYDLAVQAVDFAGNVSGQATLTTTTSDCDTAAPTVAMTSPPAGSVAGVVSLAATASDNDTVAGVQFRLDGVAIGAEDTAAPFSLSWDSRAAINGPHVLTAVARDPSGNMTTSAPLNVAVDNTGTPPPSGLVAAYALDEGAGSTIADSSGQNNGGTITNATWSALGKYGSALSFDGNGDFVAVPDSASLDATSGVTLEAWVKPSALNTNWRTVLFKEQSGNLVYALYANRNTSVPAFETYNGGVRTLNGVNQIALGFWTHLAATYDGANQRLYVNGNQVAVRAQTGAIAASTGLLKIGGNAIFGEWFAGLIDEVRVYNRALTQVEIQGDMASRVVPDTFAPSVTGTTPTAGASGVDPDASATATFSEPMNGTTFTTSTFELRDSANALVPGAVSYNAGTGVATVDTTGVLAWGATYTARIKGGASGVKDLAGNALASDHTWTFTVDPPPPPMLVLGSTTNKFSSYPAEILRAEGLNAFDSVDIAFLSPWLLGAYDVVVLGDIALTPAQVTMLTDFVTAGGNLIALSPDKQLAGLLGLTDSNTTLANGYLAVDGSNAPGAGIASQTLQFHGTADRYTPSGATVVATLYSDRSTATSSPAVTLRSVGTNGGQAAAFTYDLARSIVLTRQGNPAWVGQDRDGDAPARPNDLFFGAAAGDPQPDWLDTQRIGVPQADEQQRLLANLIVEMNRDRKPLPRFWYLPRGEKAAVVMTGDDHAVGGTEGRFAQYAAASPAGCSVALWGCVRGTSYIYPNNSHLTSSEAEAFEAQGFEISIHINTNCEAWTPSNLDLKVATQLTDFADNYPTLDPPATNRTHCVAWSDWASQPQVERAHGIRLDTNYYHHPEPWIGALPGYMTGSGMPMRFADLDGTVIDNYQAHTHMTDEAGQAYPQHADYLLDKALGPEGYYGVFTTNMHTDEVESQGSDAIVASALAHDVPVITARQLLTWLDGRNASSFGALGWNGSVLTFAISVGSGATGLQAMLPVSATGKTLSTISRSGTVVPHTAQTIKGVQYAVFAASAGTYAATYAP